MVLSVLPLVAAGDPLVRAAVPQCYACTPEALDTLGPDGGGRLLAQAVAHARERWATTRFIVDAQVVDLRPGIFPGIPVWSASPGGGTGEALLACLADEPLLELLHDGVVVAAPADALLAVAGGTLLRFRSPAHAQVVAVLLLRPLDGLRALNRPRHCARVFAPRPSAFADSGADGLPTDLLPVADMPAWAADTSLHFHSAHEALDPLPRFSEAQIAAEPLFGGASLAFARAHGGPLVNAYLDRLPADWRDDPDTVIQVKRDELAPGWTPALLEWHLDGTSRAAKRTDGTPDLRHPVRRQRQIAACIGQVAPTALLAGELVLPEIPVGADRELAHQVWKRLVHEHLARGAVRPVCAPRDRLFAYGWGGFHACSVAREPGWRCFIKMMRGRGEAAVNRVTTRGTVAWPSTGPGWPTDALGVFPQELPVDGPDDRRRT